MTADELAWKIEDYLALHGLPVEAGEIQDSGGGIAKVYLTPVGSTTISKIKRLQSDIAIHIGSQTVSAEIEGKSIVLYVRTKDKPESPTLQSLIEDEDPLTAIIGIKEVDGGVVRIKYASPRNAHTLIAGMTRYGKSQMIQTICLSIAKTSTPREAAFIVLEPKTNYELEVALSSHLLFPFARTTKKAEEIITKALQAMNDRIRAGGVVTPYVFIVVDEAWKWASESQVIKSALSSIAQIGAGANFRLIIGTQKPTADALDTLLKANINLRLIARVADSRDAATATGLPNTGAEKQIYPGQFMVFAPGIQLRVIGALSGLEEIPRPAWIKDDIEVLEEKKEEIGKSQIEEWIKANPREARELIGQWITSTNPSITDNAIATAIWGSKNNADRQKQIDRWRNSNGNLS